MLANTPLGLSMRVQTTKVRSWPCLSCDCCSPNTSAPRSTNNTLPLAEYTLLSTLQMTKPGSVVSMPVFSAQGIVVPRFNRESRLGSLPAQRACKTVGCSRAASPSAPPPWPPGASCRPVPPLKPWPPPGVTPAAAIRACTSRCCCSFSDNCASALGFAPLLSRSTPPAILRSIGVGGGGGWLPSFACPPLYSPPPARHLAFHRRGWGRWLVALLRLATAVLPAALLPVSLAKTALAAFCGLGCGLGLRLRLSLLYGLDLGLIFLFLLLDFGLCLLN